MPTFKLLSRDDKQELPVPYFIKVDTGVKSTWYGTRTTEHKEPKITFYFIFAIDALHFTNFLQFGRLAPDRQNPDYLIARLPIDSGDPALERYRECLIEIAEYFAKRSKGFESLSSEPHKQKATKLEAALIYAAFIASGRSDLYAGAIARMDNRQLFLDTVQDGDLGEIYKKYDKLPQLIGGKPKIAITNNITAAGVGSPATGAGAAAARATANAAAVAPTPSAAPPKPQ